MFNLGPSEIVIVAVVAILVFGPRLPQVAAEAAHFIGRMKRSLAELRRETGIDQEIASARRSLESSIPSEVRTLDVAGTVRRKAREMEREAEALVRRPLADPSGEAAPAEDVSEADSPRTPPQDPQGPDHRD